MIDTATTHCIVADLHKLRCWRNLILSPGCIRHDNSVVTDVVKVITEYLGRYTSLVSEYTRLYQCYQYIFSYTV